MRNCLFKTEDKMCKFLKNILVIIKMILPLRDVGVSWHSSIQFFFSPPVQPTESSRNFYIGAFLMERTFRHHLVRCIPLVSFSLLVCVFGDFFSVVHFRTLFTACVDCQFFVDGAQGLQIAKSCFRFMSLFGLSCNR